MGQWSSRAAAAARKLKIGIDLPEWLRDPRGQSLVELAIAAPVLVFALIAGVDLLRVGAIQQAIQNGARVGAEAAATDPGSSSATIRTAIWNELSGTPGLNAGSSAPVATCSGIPAAGAPACAVLPGDANADGRMDGRTAGGALCVTTTRANVCYIQVTVRYTFRTIVAWPLVPNQVTVDRTATMPML